MPMALVATSSTYRSMNFSTLSPSSCKIREVAADRNKKWRVRFSTRVLASNCKLCLLR
jgi:hypothetical protein